MVAADVDSPRPSDADTPSYKRSLNQPDFPSTEIDEIISAAKLLHSQSFHLPDLQFLPKSTSPEGILKEAMKFNIISESTYNIILSLQKEESEAFRASVGSKDITEAKHRAKSAYIPMVELNPGDSCHFMGRFMVSWEHPRGQNPCQSCLADHGAVFIRHMVDADWLYLVNLPNVKTAPHQCLDYGQKSAQKALELLKSIPARARRGLPVLVNSQGLPLSIPVRTTTTL